MPDEAVSLGERWAIVNGLPMFYRAATDAATASETPIVHVHGFGISGTYMAPTAARLARFHPTYVPDLPGYGRSRNPDHTLSIPELAQTLAAFMDEVGIDRAILLGNSMGCLISLEFAHEFPERTERAILVSPAGGPHNQPLYRGISQIALDSVRESLRLLPVAFPDYVRFGPVNSLRLFHTMTQFPLIERAMSLSLPMLVVAGTWDPLVSQERVRQWAEDHPHTTLVIHDRAAHAINFSHPRSLAKVVLAWLRDEPLTVSPADAGHIAIIQDD